MMPNRMKLFRLSFTKIPPKVVIKAAVFAPPERVAKLRFTTRKQIRALAPHAKKLRFSTLANLSEKNPWRMSPDFSDFN